MTPFRITRGYKEIRNLEAAIQATIVLHTDITNPINRIVFFIDDPASPLPMVIENTPLGPRLKVSLPISTFAAYESFLNDPTAVYGAFEDGIGRVTKLEIQMEHFAGSGFSERPGRTER